MDSQIVRFIQKNGRVIMRLARDLVTMDAGDRLPTIASISQDCNTGRGTIQTAIACLVNNGCISLSKQGHKGTIITGLDKSRLWQYTGWSTLFVACPFPSGGLVSIIGAIDYSLKEANVPFSLGYVIASHNRMKALDADRYSMILTTRLGMAISSEQFPNIVTAVDLKGCVYSDPYVLVCTSDRPDAPWDGMRLALNPLSFEQQHITNLLSARCRLEVSEMSGREALLAMRAGQVDALLSRASTFTETSKRVLGGFDYHIHSLDYLGCDAEGVAPVIAINRNNYGIERMLQDLLLPAKVAELQRRIMSGALEPSFY